MIVTALVSCGQTTSHNLLERDDDVAQNWMPPLKRFNIQVTKLMNLGRILTYRFSLRRDYLRLASLFWLHWR